MTEASKAFEGMLREITTEWIDREAISIDEIVCALAREIVYLTTQFGELSDD